MNVRPRRPSSWRIALAFLSILGALGGIAAAAPKAGPYTGHYELTDTKADWGFYLDVTQTGTSADVSFSAGMANGSGAAPDGDGKGKIGLNGVLTFTFTDSFGNEGTGSLVAGKDGYHLKMDPTKVAEPRAMRFYGDMLLKKTADKSQAQ